jgi:hypothetical protein
MGFAVLALATAAASQSRPYNVVMKEAGAAAGALRMSVESGDLAAVAAQARTLDRLFTEVETFWAKFRTKDALDAAKGVKDVAAAVGAAAAAGDRAKATAAAAGLAAQCMSCHNSHREQMPDKSYRIRP